MFHTLFQSVCHPLLLERCPAGVMAEWTAPFWPILKPSGTPASPAPGNTCEYPSLVVRDKSNYKRRGALLCVNVSHFLFSASISSGRRGPRVNRSLHDLRLHTWWEEHKVLPAAVACIRLWSEPESRPLSPAGGWYTGPTYRHQNVLITNSLEIIEKILGMCTDAWRYRTSDLCISYCFVC